ncbi:peptidylprolyl isomerase [Porticoccus sp. W117]|uniref:peptidylprolyl isomerase n=1 Tax=Porticoccus sp. W117 TaxID=3054777 RepID=UPI002595BCF2|nr:peptidylprolyl isomerase [Porticoccus sp. W117]MDM3872109.1 peptidylprolyl isomerase [Porticoccus sp. W117]
MGISVLKPLKTLLLAALLAASSAYGEKAASNAPTIAVIQTNLGEMRVELNRKAAPITCDNFIGYAKNYFYDGLIFHRVVDNFVIQTGGYWFDYRQKKPSGENIVNESANGLKNTRGTIAMARYDDPDSARAQFFINLQDNPHLDASKDEAGYTVFGKIVSGMDVADSIGKAPVKAINKDLTHVPVETIQVEHIAIEEPAP